MYSVNLSDCCAEVAVSDLGTVRVNSIGRWRRSLTPRDLCWAGLWRKENEENESLATKKFFFFQLH